MRSDQTQVIAGRVWSAGSTGRLAERQAFAERWLGLWGSAVLVLMLLYMLIGQQPYNHEALIDPETGVAPVSPINRIFWLGLLALAAPIYWFRRTLLVEMVRRLWPLVLLLVWFTATTRWALDPGVSSKRLFLYVVDVLICGAICLGVRNGHRLHQTMAVACAVMVGIDLFSAIFLHSRSVTPLGLAAIHTHKNTLGSVMLFCGIVCGTYMVSQTETRGRVFWGGVIAAAFVLLVLSKSKTSLAIFIACAALAPALVRLMQSRAVVLWSVAATAITGVGALLLGWLSWSAVQGNDPLEPLSHVTFTMRTDVWKFSLSQWAHRPLSGLGFGSFWDVDPAVQPSLQTDEWFAKPDAFTNESHNGYIDLLVTTGLIGLFGALAILVRWLYRALALLRIALLSTAEAERATLAYATYLSVFPLLFFVHNFMESSYFTANATFGSLILLIGVDLDLRWPERNRPGGISSPSLEPVVWRRSA